jgi:hypothetical protein
MDLATGPLRMIHPHSELRFVSPAIGFGVFATRPIPKGTITWVLDPLDQIVSPSLAANLPAALQHPLDVYSSQNGRGDRVLCWDHARFVNHSCHPTSLAPGFDLEIAVHDIAAGEQITDDYGSLNIETPFECHCGHKSCRRTVGPSDFGRFSDHWDERVAAAFPLISDVEQPLWALVQEQARLAAVLSGQAPLPSCRLHAQGARAGALRA